MKILRLPLHDIMGTDTEEDVMQILGRIKPTLLFDYCVWLWYVPRNTNTETVQKFQKTYCSEISCLSINVLSLNGVESTVWFDIINKKDMEFLKRFKFRLVYDDCSQLPIRLIEFANFAKSYNNNNGYRHVQKNSTNRFTKVGR